MSIPLQRSQSTYWTDIDAQLEDIASCVNHTTRAQPKHRMALVEFWAPRPGDRLLEIGCGQGDCTVVLSCAVGKTGKVVAIEGPRCNRAGPLALVTRRESPCYHTVHRLQT